MGFMMEATPVSVCRITLQILTQKKFGRETMCIPSCDSRSSIPEHETFQMRSLGGGIYDTLVLSGTELMKCILDLHRRNKGITESYSL